MTTLGHAKRRILAIVVGSVLVAIAGLAPAMAHGRDPNDRRPRGHGRVSTVCRACGHSHAIRRERFVIPDRVDGRYARVYRPYFWREVYDPVHRHHHAVYRFPVETPHGVVYEPYVYCGARLAPGGGAIIYHGRNLSVSFGW